LKTLCADLTSSTITLQKACSLILMFFVPAASYGGIKKNKYSTVLNTCSTQLFQGMVS